MTNACSELVRQVLIEGRASEDAFAASSQLAIRYLQDNARGLVFAVRLLMHIFLACLSLSLTDWPFFMPTTGRLSTAV